MIRNLFKTAWRNIQRAKGLALINVSGLAIGMAGSALIFIWLQNEVSFDLFHANRDKLYQVYGLSSNVDGHPHEISVVSQPLGPYLAQNFPEVEASARIRDINSFLITVGDKRFAHTEGYFVDPDFLHMFSFPLAEGQLKNQLATNNSITITEELAKRLYGNEDPIGRTILIDNRDIFTVTGVLKDLPQNTEFNFEFLLPWSYAVKLGGGYVNDSWLSNNTLTFVQLKPHIDPASFNRKIKNISREQSGRNDIWTHFVFPLRLRHLYNEFENGAPVGGRISTVRVFGIVAIFILLIACINFMNLTTARSEKRAREVGIRKVAGAGRALLILQFIIESFLTALISGAIALVLVRLFLPLYDQLIQTPLQLPYKSFTFWMLAFGFILATSLLAGSYPAFYLSSFRPAGIFKKQFAKVKGTFSPRKILVVLQFTFAIMLIVCTLVIRKQVQFAEDRDNGYNNRNLIHVDFSGDIERNYELIRQELLSTGTAVSVSKNMVPISQDSWHSWALRWHNEIPADTNRTITLFSTDADLIRTAGLHLITGRDINIYQYPGDSNSVLLNETAVKMMGFKEPLGQIITEPYDHKSFQVVGVVSDYVMGLPYERIPPIVTEGPGAWFTTIHIRLNPDRSTSGNLESAERIFAKYNATYPFEYQFVDLEYTRKFESEQRTKTMVGLFAFLAIFISCLGLFGLSAYVAESRTKEIGVRKVLGASVEYNPTAFHRFFKTCRIVTPHRVSLCMVRDEPLVAGFRLPGTGWLDSFFGSRLACCLDCSLHRQHPINKGGYCRSG